MFGLGSERLSYWLQQQVDALLKSLLTNKFIRAFSQLTNNRNAYEQVY